MGSLRTIFCLIFIFGTWLIPAQSGGITIQSDSTLAATNGEMRSLMARLENNTGAPQDLKLTIQAADGVRLLSTGSIVKMEAGEKIFVPIKIFIEKRLPAGTSKIALQLQNLSGKKVAGWQTVLTVEPKRLLRITADEPQMLIYRVGDSLKISAQVTNGGNQTEEAEIFASFPQYLGSQTVVKKKITVAPFTSRKVLFSRIIDRDLLRMEIFTVNIAGTNSNKEFFGNTMVTVQNALGNRRYVDPLQNSYYHDTNGNHISWSTSNPFEQYSATHNIDLRSEINLGNTKATVNMNGTYWPNLDTKMMFQNTWLRLENNEFGVQLGNLSGADLEVTMNGRGAQFFYTPTTSTGTVFTAGILEKSYNIFDPIQFDNSPHGYSVFAKTDHHMDEFRTIDAEAVWDTDPFQKSFIMKSGYTYNNKKDKAYDFDLGYGHTRAATDSENTESSVAIGFNYRQNWDKFGFTSTNYYSSGYYPGIRKGSTVLEQRVTRFLGKFSVYGAYAFNRYNPKHIEPLYNFNSFSERHRAEIGSNFTIAEKVGVNMISQVAGEQSDVFLGEYFSRSQVGFNIASISASFNYSTPNNKNRFTLTHAQGFSNYRDVTDPEYIYSFQANWQHRNLTLSTIYQHGNFLLYEGNRSGTLQTDTEKLSAILSYRHTLLNNKLSINLSALGNRDSQIGNSIALNSNIDYRIFRATRIFGNYNYNHYTRSGATSSNVYYQMGISQDLPRIGDDTVNYKNGTIKIFTFYDLNNNNTYEPQIDKPARGVKVRINRTIFISDEDGNIRYRKLPYDEYTVKPVADEWYGEVQKVNLESKETFVTLPLVKTGIVKGKLRYEKTSKFQYEVAEHFSGIPVIFRNSTGKTFTFYTNGEGEYTAYLPLGLYHISIESHSLQRNVFVGSTPDPVLSEEDQTKTLPDLILKIREKKVEVKKFGNTD